MVLDDPCLPGYECALNIPLAQWGWESCPPNPIQVVSIIKSSFVPNVEGLVLNYCMIIADAHKKTLIPGGQKLEVRVRVGAKFQFCPFRDSIFGILFALVIVNSILRTTAPFQSR